MRPATPTENRAMRTYSLLLVTSAALATVGCEFFDSGAFNAECASFKSTYESQLAEGGVLLASVPDSPENFAMGLVLNQRAVNALFAKLADTALPTLERSITVVGQTISIQVQPQIPLLQIGTAFTCPQCIGASVPFDVGIGINNDSPPMGGGTVGVQLPIGMLGRDDRKTSLVASFASIEVNELDIDLPVEINDNIMNAAEPIVTTLLTSWLRTRFDNVEVATFDSWVIGRGDIELAGRGPFVHPDAGTIVVAMQSNLQTGMQQSLEVQTALPEGADIGIIFDPSILLGMTRRMSYEGVIPQEADGSGESADGGSAFSMTVESMSSTDTGLLETRTRLWRTSSLCGTADLKASLGLSVEPGRFTFAVQDFEVVGGEGFGQLLTAGNWATSSFMDALLSTLEVTVNYDQIFGGEAEQQAEMAPFNFSIDGRGISLFLNVLDGV